MRTAVVTIVHRRHDHLGRQRQLLSGSRIPVDHHVVVAMDDPDLVDHLRSDPLTTVVSLPADPRGLPLAAARNAGAAEALRLQAELLIFLDVDCLPAEHLVGWYQQAASHPEAQGSLLCGPVAYLPPPPESGYDFSRLSGHGTHEARPCPRPGDVQTDGDPRLFWSLSFAVTAHTWAAVGGFDEGFVGYGAEDTDFGIRARFAGVPLTWVGGAVAYHQWHPTQSPPVQHLDDILRNGQLFAARWGWWPMEGWLKAFEDEGLVRWESSTSCYVRRTSTRRHASVRPHEEVSR